MKKLIVGLVTTVVVIAAGSGVAYTMRQKLVKKVCDIVPEYFADLDADHCIKGVAVALNDSEMCGMITGSAFSSNIGGQKVQIENPPMMQCLTEIAANTNNTALCDKVGGLIIAATRIDCLYAVARSNNNSSACSLIGDETQSRAGIEMNSKVCLSQLKARGSVVADGTTTSSTVAGESNNGECKFDSDCSGICENNTYWKRGCDAQTNTCKKTFDTNCAEEKETFGTYSIGKVCKSDGCQTNTLAIENKKKELSDQKKQLSDKVKEWLAARQEATALMMTSNKNCLGALSEVTNKLIIDSATKLGMLPKTMWDVTSDVTNNLLDQLGSNPKAMSAEEFISLNCNLYKALQTDLDLLEKKINKAQDEYRNLDELERILP